MSVDRRPAGVVGEKLQKVLAELGYGSRRAMEQWITSGRVVVNGEPAHLGQRVSAADRILVDGEPPRQGRQEGPRVLVLNKPAGVICTRRDPEGRPTIFDDLPGLAQGRWIAVGRLDFQSSGLLLVTNDGELANRMMHPGTGLDREYAVRVNGKLTDPQMAELKRGRMLDGERLRFSDIRYYNGSGSNHWYHVVLREGRNREVRRLFESMELTVSRLKRVRFGPVFLSSTLRSGRWAELGEEDLVALYRLLRLPMPKADRPGGRRRAERDSKPSLLLPYPELPPRPVTGPVAAPEPAPEPMASPASRQSARPGSRAGSRAGRVAAPGAGQGAETRDAGKSRTRPGARPGVKAGTKSDAKPDAKRGAKSAARTGSGRGAKPGRGPKSGPRPGPRSGAGR
jgi:23S rRNA pseudouridine2605 synthase